MDKRKTFLLRIDAGLFDQLRRLAEDEFRSLNGQIEYLLRESLRQRGRLRSSSGSAGDSGLPPAVE